MRKRLISVSIFLVLILLFSLFTGCKRNSVKPTDNEITQGQKGHGDLEEDEDEPKEAVPSPEPTPGDTDEKGEEGEDSEEPRVEGPSRADTFYVEEVVRNFGGLFPIVASRADIDISVLDTMVFKDGELYRELEKELKEYRDQRAVVVFEDFYIAALKEVTGKLFEVTVEQIISVTVDGSAEEDNSKVIYVVEVRGDDIGIVDRKK
jgi:hypothetical protein